MERVARAVDATFGPEVVGVVLLGGYARGEGGYVTRGGGIAPYNDYDLMVVLRTAGKRVRAQLGELGKRLSGEVGVDVDLWPVTLELMRRPPHTLLWLDAALGGARVLRGPRDLLESLHGHSARRVPLAEAGRLLANRAVGVALSNLESFDRCPERAARHVHKAVLACGDAHLLAADRYRATVRERAVELKALATAPNIGPALVRRYSEALQFRLAPDVWLARHAPTERWFEQRRREVARWHLDFEAWRIGTPREVGGFVEHSGQLFSGAPDLPQWGRNLAAARAVVKGNAPALPWVGHPRERLARVAVGLAYGFESEATTASALRLLGISRAHHGSPRAATDEIRVERLTVRERLLRLAHAGG